MIAAATQVLHSAPYDSMFTGPTVWRGSDFRDPGSGLYHLKPETIAEMESNARMLRAAGRITASVTAQDFPLPSFEADAARLREQLYTGTGFFIVKGLPIERYTEEEACLLYWGLSVHLGEPIKQNVAG